MSRFDEILDEVIEKARIAADVAGKKTNEVVEYSKLKYKSKQVSWDIEKAYAKLGAFVYEARKSGESYDDVIMLAEEELDMLHTRLDDLEEQLGDLKKTGEATREARSARAKPAENDVVVEVNFTEEE